MNGIQKENNYYSLKAEPIGEQKPVEWSEEDENRFNNLILLVEYSDENKPTKKGFIDFINRLKSLRPQNTWKPSDEQIEALESATENCAYSEYQDCLRELITQLQKLRGNKV